MAKRNDIAPYERREARKWTRIADYVPTAEAHVRDVRWPTPGTLAPFPAARSSFGRRTAGGRRGLLIPAFAVVLSVGLSLWASDGFQSAMVPARPDAVTSRGLKFGLCSEGGLTNCVASGDSFYLGGKTVRMARIEAPQLYGAACPQEAQLGRLSAAKLQQLLNSGEIELNKVPQDTERYGLLLRTVAVDGKDAGEAMIASGLAREIGDTARNWC